MGWSWVALIAFLAACSGGPPEVQDLLLDSGDFSGQAVVESKAQISETAQGDASAQVELSGPDFVLGQSLVLFENQDSARAVLAEIEKDQLARDTYPIEPGNFKDVSEVLIERRGGDETLTLIFVEGRALVRIPLSGPGRRALLPVYAEEARAKAGKQ